VDFQSSRSLFQSGIGVAAKFEGGGMKAKRNIS